MILHSAAFRASVFAIRPLYHIPLLPGNAEVNFVAAGFGLRLKLCYADKRMLKPAATGIFFYGISR